MPSYTAKFTVKITIAETEKYGYWTIARKAINAWLKHEIMFVAEGIVAAGSETVHHSPIVLVLRRAKKEGFFKYNEYGVKNL